MVFSLFTRQMVHHRRVSSRAVTGILAVPVVSADPLLQPSFLPSQIQFRPPLGTTYLWAQNADSFSLKQRLRRDEELSDDVSAAIEGTL